MEDLEMCGGEGVFLYAVSCACRGQDKGEQGGTARCASEQEEQLEQWHCTESESSSLFELSHHQ